MRSIHLIIGAALLFGAGATEARTRLTPEAKLAKLLDGRVAGKPVNCLNLRDIRSSEIIDDTAIVYRMGRTLYVNRPRGGAESLDGNDVLLTRTYTGSLCSIDTVNLIDRNTQFQRGFVSLGQFVPYTKPK
ncbi:hypothetical protein ACFOKI_14330 [Sphingomonas qilianensis]|uniref:Uncharacterized protein n=1 Tax=Sphingomonas qilianensis TaxID=1736690 RepID=A0ABU9XMQ0_9SPHN